MENSFVDLVGLTRARLRHLPFRERDTPPFDVEGSHMPVARAKLADLLDEHATLSGQTHALTRDRWQLLFSKGRRAVIPFHERAFSFVAWRDPIGPASERLGALDALRRYGAHTGKHVLALAVSEATRDIGVRLGFSSIWLGSEQMFALERFSMRGKTGEKLRLAVNHARRAGVTVRELMPQHAAGERAAIAEVARAWMAARPEREMRSFLRTDPLENAHMRRYFAAETMTPAGPRMEAFLVCAPVSRRGWYLQDLVRRPTAPRGAGELVSVAALEALRDEGVEFATMGIVPFLEAGGPPPDDAPGPAASFCIRHFDGAFRFSGLQRFRAKFPATQIVSVHALVWPRVLTPMAAWDVIRVLG